MNHKVFILPLLMTALFTSCSPAQSESKNDRTVSEYVIDESQKILWQDCLSQKEDHYLVFFYSDYCGHCHQIMGDVLAFSNDNIVKLYFLDVKDPDNEVTISNAIDETIGKSNIDDLCIAGTPTIIEIEDQIVKANVPGKENCLSLLNELRLNNI